VGSIGRNEKCWCGSGLKYKKCHLALDNSPSDKKLDIEHQTYLKRWNTNSKSFDTQSCYSWMAQKILGSSTSLILDIGCGDGVGIKNLLSTSQSPDLKIISIDENISCLREAKNTLESLSYSVDLIERCQVTYSNGQHSYEFSPIKINPVKQVTLIQSDILSDPHIEPYLESIGDFDAITVWLIGTHLERKNCINLSALNLTSSGKYRLLIQNKIYELADRILKSKGVLQIVDRTEPPSSEALKQDFINTHNDQASVTSLVVYDLDYMIYYEPNAQSRIAMQKTLGTSGRNPDLSQTAMTSILSRK